MYQYRNLPPRHQAPGFYPPHQPSLRTHTHPSQTPHQHTLNPIDDQHHTQSYPLTRSHSHGLLHHTSPPHTPPHHTSTTTGTPSSNGYRTHHIISPQHNHSHTHAPSVSDALQQMQRIKAATACQIINSRVVEAIRQQQHQKQQEKILKKKLYPNWKDPNETNPNNPAYKGPHNAKLMKQQSKKKKKCKTNTELDEDSDEEGNNELTENDKMMTIPQLEISTAPKSTANITNLTDEELKMNPELYKMYSYYIPFANTSPHNSTTTTHTQSLRSQSLPPTLPPNSPHSETRTTTLTTQTSPPLNNTHKPHSHSHHHHRTNMGPRRRNPNFLKPQYNMGSDEDIQPNIVTNGVNANQSPSVSIVSVSPQRVFSPKTKLVPVGKVKPNPLERLSPNVNVAKTQNKRKHYEPHMAPAHANVQSVISPNGGIYHPCHGYSTRDISIFDLFPGIVKYQSKKYAECDRVDYLSRLSEKSFCSVNNRPLKIDESEMWYTALKYLFNDITLGQFDYMSAEMRYVIKQYMSTHKNRLSFLNSIKNYGFLRVISDISKKLPVERIQKIIKAEKEKKERAKLLQMYRGHRSQAPPPPPHTHGYGLIQPQYIGVGVPINHMSPNGLSLGAGAHHRGHYADWYNGNRLKRTISEPTPMRYTTTKLNKPMIIDEDDEDMEGIDDSWDFMTKIVNNNTINDSVDIPDLPPEKVKVKSKDKNNMIEDESDEREWIGDVAEGKLKKDALKNRMSEVVDVYTMLYQSMKGKKEKDSETSTANDNGPNISFADLTNMNDLHTNMQCSDKFVPKVNSNK